MKNNMYLITFFFIIIIRFTYRACRDSHQWETRTPDTLGGMGANAPTGTPGIHITPGSRLRGSTRGTTVTLAPCLINTYLLDKGFKSRLTKAEIMNQFSKSNPPWVQRRKGARRLCLKDV
jgi:hypothetical protein